MPALLSEGLVGIKNTGIEYSIQIYIHEITEILIVAAGNRIYCLVRICHCIKEGVETALGKLNKRILNRIVLRTAQYRML